MNNQNTNRKKIALTAVLLLGLGGLITLSLQPAAPPPTAQASHLSATVKGTVARFVLSPERAQIADLRFTDANGSPKTLADFKGKVILLNLWATWCAPCRKEMPDLNALQKQMGSPDFQVLALSLDNKGMPAVQSFLEGVGASSITPYLDASASALGKVQGLGLPTTLLIDRRGREIGRLVGPAEWNTPEAQALIKAAIDEKS